MLGGEIKVVMTLDDRDFAIKTINAGRVVSDLKRTLEDTAKSTKRLENHFTSFGQKFRDVTLSISLARFALQDINDIFLSFPLAVLKSGGEIERMQKLMEGLSKATTDYARKAEAAAGVKFVFDMAKKAPFEVKALTDAFVKFKSAGLDPTNGSLQGLIDSVASFGGSSEQLKRASIAIQQMAGKGVISMEELRQQLGEAVPDAMQMMARGAGVSMAELAKKVGDGVVVANTALNQMFTVMTIEKRGAAAEMMTTWTGMVELLKTKWELFKVQIAQGGFLDGAKQELQGLLDAFDTIDGKKFAISLGQGLKSFIDGIRSTIQFVKTYSSELKTAGQIALLYFAGSKVVGALSALKNGYSAIISRVKEVSAVKAEAIAKEIALERQAAATRASELRAKIAANQAEIQSQDKVNRVNQATALKRLQEEQATNKSILADRQAMYTRLSQLAVEAQREAELYAAKSAAIASRNAGWAGSVGAARRATTANEYAKTAADLRQRAAAELEVISATNKQIIATDKAIASARTYTQVTTQTQRSLLLQNQSLVAAANQFEKASQAVTKMTLAQRAAVGVASASRVVWMALGGWIGVVTTALTAGVFAWMNYKTAAEKATAAVDRYNNARAGTTTREEKAENDQSIANSQKFIDLKTRQLKLNTTGKNSAERRAIEKSIADENVKLRKFRETQTLQNISLAKTEQDRELQIYEKNTQEAQKKRDAIFRNIQVQTELWAEERLKSVAAKDIKTREKINKEKSELLVKNYKAQAKMDKDFATQEFLRLDAQAKMATGAERALLEQKRNMWAPKLEAAAQLQENTSTLGELNTTAKLGKGAGSGSGVAKLTEAQKAARKAAEAYSGALDDMREKVIALDAQLAGGSIDKDIAKILFQAEQAGVKGAKLKELENNLRSLGELAKEKSRLLDNQQNALSLLDSMREKLAGLKEEAIGGASALGRMEERLNEIDFGPMTAEATAAVAQMRDLIQEMKNLQSAKQQKKGDKLGFRFEQDAGELRSSLKDQEGQLRDSLAREAAMRAKQIEDLKLQPEQAKNAWAGYFDWFSAASEKLAVDLEGPLDKLARGWADTAAQMKQASANWAYQTMDILSRVAITGKLEWRSLVQSMLADFMRIQTQNLFGKPLQQVFNGIGDWATGLLSGGKQGAAGQNAGANATGDSAASLGKIFKETGMTTGLLQTAMETFNKEGVTASTISLIESLGIGTAKQVAETYAIQSLNALATAAANAAVNMGGSAGGGGGGAGFWGGLVSAAFGGGAGAGMSGATYAGAQNFMANGGIMTKMGSLPLTKYAKGGIANRPQVAIYGEGSMNEAIIPLPDGRTVPVSLSGAAGNSNVVTIQINVTNEGESASVKGKDESMNWNSMAQQVKALVVSEIRNQKRPNGELAR